MGMNERSDFPSLSRNSRLTELRGPDPRVQPHSPESEAESCSAFGYLRGLQERAVGLELRLKDGNREWFPYALLADCRFNPSVGVLLRFTSDVTTLVLVRGSNLDLPVNSGTIDLIERGLERHRVLWIREMAEGELHRAGEREPTIDRVEFAECETRKEAIDWLTQVAPGFVRR